MKNLSFNPYQCFKQQHMNFACFAFLYSQCGGMSMSKSECISLISRLTQHELTCTTVFRSEVQ